MRSLYIYLDNVNKKFKKKVHYFFIICVQLEIAKSMKMKGATIIVQHSLQIIPHKIFVGPWECTTLGSSVVMTSKFWFET